MRGAYSDAAAAARIVASLGGMRAIGDERLGDRVAPALAQPGDIGLVLSNDRECFSVCFGEWWLAPSLTGLENLPVESVVVAWRCTKDEQ
jgi:hypothetical protein